MSLPQNAQTDPTRMGGGGKGAGPIPSAPAPAGVKRPHPGLGNPAFVAHVGKLMSAGHPIYNAVPMAENHFGMDNPTAVPGMKSIGPGPGPTSVPGTMSQSSDGGTSTMAQTPNPSSPQPFPISSAYGV